MIKELIVVGIGGAIGSILRFLTSKISVHFYNGIFPLPTFIVNLLGCFLIGILIAYFSQHPANQQLRLLMITGFCGGFTTFSTFSSENLVLFQNGNIGVGALYLGLSVLGGVLAVWLGMRVV